MPGVTMSEAGRKAGPDAALFFRHWLANPLRMGSVVPTSLRRIAASVARGPGEAVLHLGAGTGVVSRVLRDAGVPPERLTVVEIVPDIAEHLRHVLPGVEVLCGDAFDLGQVLPKRQHGRIGTAICSIPLVLLPVAEQRRFVDAVAQGRGFLLYTYCITSTLRHRKLGLAARREAWTPWNLPPASVWRYWHGDVRTLS